MKKAILLSVLGFSLISTQAQQKNTGFAVTSDVKGSYNWITVREIDLSTGEVVRTVYDPTANQTVTLKNADGQLLARANYTSAPTYSGVAAAAYDEKHNRLYFTNMRGNELRYFDLTSGQQLTMVINEDSRFNTGVKTDEANVITRMVIAADGYGYALTNDAKSLIRFTTDAKPTITNLGALVDVSKNTISVHNQCSSWGGDMIADAYGNLYVFTMKGNVFKVNPKTLSAEHTGTVQGLPGSFTINGAAVDLNGDVVVTSAALTENYYKINLGTLDATTITKTTNDVWNASDLATSNIAYRNAIAATPTLTEKRGNDVISVYPNPVAASFFNVSFEKATPGKYTIELTDASGRKVTTQVADIKGVQNQQVALPRSTAGGIYMIRVLNADGKSVYTDKVVVQ
jgi:hypothetical protein